MDPTDVFLKASDNFGLSLAILIAATVIIGLAFVREWVVSGRTHRRELAAAEAKSDAWEQLFRDSAGLNIEQVAANRKAAEFAELVAARMRRAG